MHWKSAYGIGPDEVDLRREFAERRERFGPLVDVAAYSRRSRRTVALQVLGHELLGRPGQDHEPGAELVGRVDARSR